MISPSETLNARAGKFGPGAKRSPSVSVMVHRGRADLESGLQLAADWPRNLVFGAVMNRLCSPRIMSVFALLMLQVVPATARDGGGDPSAQMASTTAGAITGTITDATGAVLAGVTMTLSGGALMGTRTTTSDSDGGYRFPALPPGEYSLIFSRQGFTRGTRNGLHFGPGFAATVDMTLALEGVRADLTVALPGVQMQINRSGPEEPLLRTLADTLPGTKHGGVSRSACRTADAVSGSPRRVSRSDGPSRRPWTTATCVFWPSQSARDGRTTSRSRICASRMASASPATAASPDSSRCSTC